jgi:regulatory protein
MKPSSSSRLSLKGRALQWLAQREHSVIELRRKLLRSAKAEARSWALKERPQGRSAPSPPPAGDEETWGGPAFPHEGERTAGDEDVSTALSIAQAVEDTIAWLQAHQYLSNERFVESRVHARASRFGNLRIRQELAQHGLMMGEEESQRLADSEFDRARTVWLRKFSASPAESPAERARQARFLAQRGFSGEVIRRVLRDGHDFRNDDDIPDGV